MIPLRIVKVRNLPCVFEAGGGRTRTGFARVVAGFDGSPKRPALVIHRVCGEQAAVPVDRGDYIVTVYRRDDQVVGLVHRMFKKPDVSWLDEGSVVFPNHETLALLYVGALEDYEGYARAAFEAAVEKSYCLHCAEPHFVAPKESEVPRNMVPGLFTQEQLDTLLKVDKEDEEEKLDVTSIDNERT